MSTILVVDDEQDIRETLRDFLEDEGYRTEVARDGAEALQLLHSLPELPNLILTDLMMPGITGWELLATLATDEKLSRIPRLVMTAAQHDLQIDDTVVLHKPLAPSTLLRAIVQCGEAAAEPNGHASGP